MSTPRLLTRLPTRPNLQRIPVRSYAAVAHAGVAEQQFEAVQPIQRYNPLQPPSHKPADLRKSQLHRQYTSLLRTSPLLIAFQHNNLRANEWAGIRRELAHALRRVSADPSAPQLPFDPAEAIRLQVIAPGIFGAALRVVEYFKPQTEADAEGVHATEQHNTELNHALSKRAYRAGFMKVKTKSGKHILIKRRPKFGRILRGPIAVLSFPTVTPQHLAAALSILAPTTGSSSAFPAPKRRAQPGLYEGPVQSGLQKLLLLGARVEGRVLDQDGVKWVGGVKGGIDGLRAQLVHTLQNAGMGLANVLEGASKALYVTMESRRLDMEEKEGGGAKAEEKTEV